MEKDRKIKLTKEMKIFLLSAIQEGSIDIFEFEEKFGLDITNQMKIPTEINIIEHDCIDCERITSKIEENRQNRQ
jgi:hypothetical protein